MALVLLFRSSASGGPSHGFPTAGLLASWDLANAPQTIPNLIPGGAALQLGTTAGIDAADPVSTPQGLVFDGATSLATAAALTVSSPITIIVIAKNADTSSLHIFLAGPDNSQLVFRSIIGGRINLQQTNVVDILTSVTAVTDLAYHYVAASYDGATGKIWINGVLDATNAVVATITPFSPMIGVAAFNSAWMKGTICHVAIYSRAISAAEHLKIYQSLKSTWAKRGVVIV